MGPLVKLLVLKHSEGVRRRRRHGIMDESSAQVVEGGA
jgi:hypothetical protein